MRTAVRRRLHTLLPRGLVPLAMVLTIALVDGQRVVGPGKKTGACEGAGTTVLKAGTLNVPN